MSSAVNVVLLRDPTGIGAAAKLMAGLECARCEAEGYSPTCPNCLGVSTQALRNGGEP